MKHLNKLFAAALLFAGMSTQAQDSNNPWAISFGANAVDTKVSATGNDSPKWIQLVNAKENWNYLPAISYVNVSKYVGDGFTFGVTGSVNKIEKWATRVPGTQSTDLITNPGNLSYYGFDATVRYSFMEMLKSKWFEPSLSIGGGYLFVGDASAGTVNGGLGFTFWFSEKVGLQLQSVYKHSFDDTRLPNVDVPTHIQHFAGLTFKFGGKDTDGDGIYDKNGTCPEVAGLPEFNGCPDTDKDGIQDSEDACPDEAGSKELNGCPDNDGDGIINSEDACPDDKGTKMMKGCPDADGDGVADKDDKCPTVAGAKDNGGCPWPDTDGDGVADKDDKCPTVKGTAANNGCPEITEEKVKAINDAAKNIFFQTGTNKLTKESLTTLDGIAFIMLEHPEARFTIEGHTDSVGSDASNQKLSENRAAAVKNYLLSKGVKSDSISSVGYGESKPIADNKTAVGRSKNRRVDVKLVK